MLFAFFAFEKDRVWCGTGWALNRNKFGVVCRGFQLFLALNRRGIRGGARVRVHACVRPLGWVGFGARLPVDEHGLIEQLQG